MRRIEQVREVLVRELGSIIRRELDVPPSTLVTITEIVISPDLAHARVRVSIFPDAERRSIMRELDARVAEFRALLGTHLPSLHPLPHLEFELDERVAEAARVENLAEKLKNEAKDRLVK
jgi:ribosome-binding factor A